VEGQRLRIGANIREQTVDEGLAGYTWLQQDLVLDRRRRGWTCREAVARGHDAALDDRIVIVETVARTRANAAQALVVGVPLARLDRFPRTREAIERHVRHLVRADRNSRSDDAGRPLHGTGPFEPDHVRPLASRVVAHDDVGPLHAHYGRR